jgi:serine/threonine-protein kinase
VDFDEVIARGLAKDPDARYHSAQQLATAARHALAQDPPTFRPTPPAQPPTLIDTPGPAAPTGTPGQTLAATQVPPAYTLSPATDEPRRSRKPWIIAAAAAATVITTAIAVVIIHPWARPTRTVAPDRLDSILLTAQEADTIMGATNLQPPKSIRHATYTDPPLTTSNPQCLSKSVPARDEVYQSTGYTAVSADMLSAPKGEPERYVNQAAVSFASADKSLAFVKSSAGAWRACARQSYTVTVDGQTDRWTPGNVVGVTPEISQLRTLDGGGDFACQHVLSAVLNLVVDVRACGYKVNEQARQVADKMAAKATS